MVREPEALSTPVIPRRLADEGSGSSNACSTARLDSSGAARRRRDDNRPPQTRHAQKREDRGSRIEDGGLGPRCHPLFSVLCPRLARDLCHGEWARHALRIMPRVTVTRIAAPAAGAPVDKLGVPPGAVRRTKAELRAAGRTHRPGRPRVNYRLSLHRSKHAAAEEASNELVKVSRMPSGRAR